MERERKKSSSYLCRKAVTQIRLTLSQYRCDLRGKKIVLMSVFCTMAGLEVLCSEPPAALRHALLIWDRSWLSDGRSRYQPVRTLAQDTHFHVKAVALLLGPAK